MNSDCRWGVTPEKVLLPSRIAQSSRAVKILGFGNIMFSMVSVPAVLALQQGFHEMGFTVNIFQTVVRESYFMYAYRGSPRRRSRYSGAKCDHTHIPTPLLPSLQPHMRQQSLVLRHQSLYLLYYAWFADFATRGSFFVRSSQCEHVMCNAHGPILIFHQHRLVEPDESCSTFEVSFCTIGSIPKQNALKCQQKRIFSHILLAWKRRPLGNLRTKIDGNLSL